MYVTWKLIIKCKTAKRIYMALSPTSDNCLGPLL